MNKETEPVRVTAAITAAVVATTALIGVIFDLAPAVIAAVDAVVIAWIGVASHFLRGLVTPVANVDPEES